jgi:DNA-binding HxlR family transcriptional regulator
MNPVATAAVPAPARARPVDPMDQLVADVFARACPSRAVLENVAAKWGILALAALREGTYRFNALRRRVDGISEKMLAQTLHALERDGLVRRDVQATIPPRVEYSLTPVGARIAAKLFELIELVEGEMAAVADAQARYDRARP